MLRPMRAATALLAALIAAAPAAASTLETIDVPSAGNVDPAKVPFNDPPDGSKRPNALRALVMLPDGYEASGSYPVLYLLGGHGETYDAWAHPSRGDVQRTLAGFPGIVVMPEGARGWYANWWNGGRRGEPAWERYHLDELIPAVERRYPIRTGRRWRAIAGNSMGGLGAMFYASQRPGYFGSAASFSGVLAPDRGDWPAAIETQGERFEDVYGPQRFYVEGHSPTALIRSLAATRLWTSNGDGTPAPAPEQLRNGAGAAAEAYLRLHQADFTTAARSIGADLTTRTQQGIHDWPYWKADLRDSARWGFFAQVEDSPSQWGYGTVAREGRMWDLGYRFAAPPQALARFTRDGSRLSATGAGTVALTTAGACELSASLPFADLELPAGRCGAAERIRIRVAPRRARAGRRVRLRIRASVGGARVRVGRRRTLTASNGRARLTVRFRRPGRARVSARKPDLAPGSATVRVLRAARPRR